MLAGELAEGLAAEFTGELAGELARELAGPPPSEYAGELAERVGAAYEESDASGGELLTAGVNVVYTAFGLGQDTTCPLIVAVIQSSLAGLGVGAAAVAGCAYGFLHDTT